MPSAQPPPPSPAAGRMLLVLFTVCFNEATMVYDKDNGNSQRNVILNILSFKLLFISTVNCPKLPKQVDEVGFIEHKSKILSNIKI